MGKAAPLCGKWSHSWRVLCCYLPAPQHVQCHRWTAGPSMQQIIWKSGFILGWCNLYAVVLRDCEIFFDGDFSIIRCVSFVAEIHQSWTWRRLVLCCYHRPIVKPFPPINYFSNLRSRLNQQQTRTLMVQNTLWKFLFLFFGFSSKHQTRHKRPCVIMT